MDTAASAATYMLFGWRPIPIPAREKSPRIPNWTAYVAPESDLDRVFRDPSNIGILLGEPSGHLIDVDLDHPEAVRLADQYLPPTAAVFGRESKPRSHRLYYVPGGMASKKFQTARTTTAGSIMFVEIRSTGLQTVFPPSMHPSGERIEWDDSGTTGDPATISAEALQTAVGELADAAMLAAGVTAKASDNGTARLHPGNGNSTRMEPIDSEDAVKRALLYIAKMPGAVSGQGGHAATLTAANALVNGFCLSVPVALDILEQVYNPRCDPPWTEKELRHKCNEAVKLGSRNPQGWLLNSPRVGGGGEPDDSIYEGGDPFSGKSAAPAADETPDAGNENGTKTSPKATAPSLPEWISARELVQNNPTLAEPIIDGILRTGETMNLIAAPKTGKSVIAMGLALSICTGTLWMGTFSTRRAKVLYIDNELHPATAAFRLGKAAAAMGVPLSEYGDQIDVACLRGKLRDLNQLCRILEKVEVGRFGLVVIDAFYRTLPSGVEENDNAGMAGLYNRLDQTAAKIGAAFCLVHHTSKGAQGEKSVTDVGSGAGAQSRAADAHIVLRPHEEDGAVVMDGVVRSFPPIPARVFRLQFPLFVPDTAGLDPADLRTSKPRRKAKGGDGWGEPDSSPQMTATAFVDRFIGSRERVAATLAGDAADAGIDRATYRILLARAIEDNLIYRKPGRITVYAKHTPI